ncbi:MAG: hypothetical protein ACTIA5_12790 [Brachybacterium tyrofermentans]
MEPHANDNTSTWLDTRAREAREAGEEPLSVDALHELHPDEEVLVALRILEGADDLPLRRLRELFELVEYVHDVSLWVHNPYVFAKDLPAVAKRRPQWSARPVYGHQAHVHYAHYGSDPVIVVPYLVGAAIFLLKVLPALHPYVQTFISRPSRRVRTSQDDADVAENELRKAEAETKLRILQDRPAALDAQAPREPEERAELAKSAVTDAVVAINEAASRRKPKS